MWLVQKIPTGLGDTIAARDGGVRKTSELLITADGLAALMQGRTPTKSDDVQHRCRPRKEKLLKNARFTYDSISPFSVWGANDRGKGAQLILERQGISWKLVSLIVPTDERP